MNERYLIGLDAGTTSLKGVIIKENGHVVATAGTEYTLDTPSKDICELDPEIYWEKSLFVIRALLDTAQVAAEKIKALAFSSQGETLITVDQNGKPLRKAIVWLDNRSCEEAVEMEAHFGKKPVLSITGQPEILPIWPATRILWLRKNEPDIFKKAKKYLLVEDFLVHKLTNKFVSNESMLSSTLYFDIVAKKWWADMLSWLAITPDHLPDIQCSGQPVGTLTKEAAQATGLSPETVVISGSYDHPAGAIGAGNIFSGMVTETTGAAMAMCVTIDEPIFDANLNLPCQCHSVPGKYFVLPYGQTAGMVLKWFKEQFCDSESIEADKTGKDVYEILSGLAASVSPGSEGLTMLPHLMGTGSPEFNPNAKGVYCGISLGMGKGHFIRALMESVACMVQRNIKTLERFFSIHEIRALGGGAKSDLWNQIKADLSGKNICTLQNVETPSLGAAILAGVGCGLYKDIQQGCAHVVKIKNTFEPDSSQNKIYQDIYKRYINLYDALVPIWGK